MKVVTPNGDAIARTVETAVSTPPAAPLEPPGLRERKKLRTRLRLQQEALRRFAEQGYERTTVEQICAAAEVSPSTFFRYFPTKEDVVFWDDYNPLLGELLAARPPHEPPLRAVRNALLEGVARVFHLDQEDILTQARLVLSVPALRARMWEQQAATQRVLAGVLAGRTGADPADYRVLVAAAACAGAVTTAVQAWADSGGGKHFTTLVDRAFDLLAAGLPLGAKLVG